MLGNSVSACKASLAIAAMRICSHTTGSQQIPAKINKPIDAVNQGAVSDHPERYAKYKPVAGCMRMVGDVNHQSARTTNFETSACATMLLLRFTKNM